MTIWAIVPFSRRAFASSVACDFMCQTHVDARLVIVENGDAVGTWRTGEAIVLRSRHNVSDATNVGLAVVRQLAKPGDVVCEWDDDDRYLPRYLEKLAALFASRPDVDAAGKDALWVQAEDGSLWFLDGDADRFVDRRVPRGPTLAARVECFPDFVPRDGPGTDTAWGQSLVAAGRRVWLMSAADFVFCRHGERAGHLWLGGSIDGLRLAFGNRLRRVARGEPTDDRPTIRHGEEPLDVSKAMRSLSS